MACVDVRLLHGIAAHQRACRARRQRRARRAVRRRQQRIANQHVGQRHRAAVGRHHAVADRRAQRVRTRRGHTLGQYEGCYHVRDRARGRRGAHRVTGARRDRRDHRLAAFDNAVGQRRHHQVGRRRTGRNHHRGHVRVIDAIGRRARVGDIDRTRRRGRTPGHRHREGQAAPLAHRWRTADAHRQRRRHVRDRARARRVGCCHASRQCAQIDDDRFITLGDRIR